MHFCEAKVAIAGDDQQILYRGYFNPVSWPEIEVLRYLHGDDAVRDVKAFVSVEQSGRAERERLLLKYGSEPVNTCFTGRPPRIELEAPDVEIDYGARWRNPVTDQLETIERPPEEVKLPLSKTKVKTAAESGL